MATWANIISYVYVPKGAYQLGHDGKHYNMRWISIHIPLITAQVN